MARIKLVYIGGGSTRAPGTMASLIDQGRNFEGSEIVLVDLREDRLDIVKRLTEKMVRAQGLDLRISATVDRRRALDGCDAVLTSYRPGGFEARFLDESIPLQYGVIGQETQGPGGFFMALRSIHVMKGIIEDMQQICPTARLFNYTNPINIVSQAVSSFSPVWNVSLCEGPIIFPRGLAVAADLDPDKVDATMIGLNHGSWSVRHLYDGQDMIPLLQRAYERKQDDPSASVHQVRMLRLAAMMESIPAAYFQYYYFKDEVYTELLAKPTTRAQDIMAKTATYWAHYSELADHDRPVLDPQRSRGGVHELELAIDVMDALYNDRGEVWPVNYVNNGAIADLSDDLVVEVPGFVDRNGVAPLVSGRLPSHLSGLVKALAEYQQCTADAAWNGTRRDAIRALASNPLVSSLQKAEAIYDDMAANLREYLPERLLQ